MHSWLHYLWANFGVRLDFGAEFEFYCDVSLEELQVAFPSLMIIKEDGFQQCEFRTPVFVDPYELVSFIEYWKGAIVNYALSASHYISFAAKPKLDQPGSAAHFHLKFFADNPETFEMAAIGGLCYFMRNSMIYFAPNEDSYQRLLTHNIHTANSSSWGNCNNRSVAIRRFAADNRLECRMPGADCLVKESLWAIVQAAVLGIVIDILPPKPIYGFANKGMCDAAAKLPITLEEAKSCGPLLLESDVSMVIERYRAVQHGCKA